MSFSAFRRSVAAFVACFVSLTSSAVSADEELVLRLGWQTPWAVQGQLVMGLTETEIGSDLGLAFERVGFAYGGPLNAGALSGNVDLVLTADQPALVLLSRSDDFAVIGRMMYNRTCVYVPPGSEITTLSELEGKSVFGPVGASAERVARAAIIAAGVDEAKLDYGALDMAQQRALLSSAGPGAESWRGVDALYGFDPLPADFEENNLAKMIFCDKVLSVVLARKDVIAAHPEEIASFMCAFEASWLQYAKEPAAMNERFRTVSSLTTSDAALDRAATLEENYLATQASEVRLEFSETDYGIFDDAAAFLAERGIIPEALDVRAHVDLAPLNTRNANGRCDAVLAEVPYPLNEAQ